MRQKHIFMVLIALLGYVPLQPGCPDFLRASHVSAEQLISDERLQAIEVVHKQNIGQLHGLHHDLRASFKQLTRHPSDQAAARQLEEQLRAVAQTLDTVAMTEREHPQWASNWSQRHARLVALTQEMQGLLLHGPGGQDGNRLFAQLGKKLEEMKAILDIW